LSIRLRELGVGAELIGSFPKIVFELFNSCNQSFFYGFVLSALEA